MIFYKKNSTREFFIVQTEPSVIIIYSGMSIDERYDTFEFLAVELIGELLLITQINGVRARNEVAAAEPEEQRSRP